MNDWGAPGDLTRMRDGRIACVYGYRLPPFGLRARLSEDGGRTWGREIVLRDDGGSWDLGYPRVIEHEPGRLLCVYYMNLQERPDPAEWRRAPHRADHVHARVSHSSGICAQSGASGRQPMIASMKKKPIT